MNKKLDIAFFGSSLVSAYWNGAATYYRGIIRALNSRGHQITFYEPDAYDRQKHRDIEDPEWANVVVYSPDTEKGVYDALREAANADVIIKTSGVGANDELLESAVLNTGGPATLRIYWDVDAPATLERVRNDPNDPFRGLIPRYDLVLTYGGGQPVVDGYCSLGAKECVPIYNALDIDTHHPVERDSRFEADLALLANRLPDREARIDEFFFKVAEQMSNRKFVLGGSGWYDKPMPRNVNYVGHVYTRDHNAFNSTPLAVLNVSRDSMAENGFSPATRVFEAAGAGACIITDEWKGIDLFLETGREILVAKTGTEVANHLRALNIATSRNIGAAAMQRVTTEHTYQHRVEQLEKLLQRRVRTAAA
jgi:spore maturation protein CgeB